MVVIAALALSALTARLVQIQGLDRATYASYGAQEVYQHVALPALRGAVYDRNGNLLVDSVPMLTGYYPAANLLCQFVYLGIGSAYIINASGVAMALTNGESTGISNSRVVTSKPFW